jgi:hypothetical protein
LVVELRGADHPIGWLAIAKAVQTVPEQEPAPIGHHQLIAVNGNPRAGTHPFRVCGVIVVVPVRRREEPLIRLVNNARLRSRNWGGKTQYILDVDVN